MFDRMIASMVLASGYKMVAHSLLIAPMIESIKELKKEKDNFSNESFTLFQNTNAIRHRSSLAHR